MTVTTLRSLGASGKSKEVLMGGIGRNSLVRARPTVLRRRSLTTMVKKNSTYPLHNAMQSECTPDLSPPNKTLKQTVNLP